MLTEKEYLEILKKLIKHEQALKTHNNTEIHAIEIEIITKVINEYVRK